MRRPKGALALDLLLGPRRLDRAARARVRGARHVTTINSRGRHGASRSSRRRCSSAAAKVVILISTSGSCSAGWAASRAASRMTFAFSRDGAIPGPQAVAATQQAPHADLVRAVRRPVRARDHLAGLLREQGRARRSRSSRSRRSRRSASTSPTRSRCTCAGAWAIASRPARGPSARKYKWVNLDRDRLGGAERDHLQPAGDAGRRVLVKHGFSWYGGQLRAARQHRRVPRRRDLVAGRRPRTRSRARCARSDRRVAAMRSEGRRSPPARRRRRRLPDDADSHRARHRGGARRDPARGRGRGRRGRRPRAGGAAGVARARARRARGGRCARSPTRSRRTSRSWRCSRRATPASRSATRAARWRWSSTPSATTRARPSGCSATRSRSRAARRSRCASRSASSG